MINTTEIVVIYRVQTKDKEGPYYSPCRTLLCDSQDLDGRHPMPQDDSKLMQNLSYVDIDHYFDSLLKYAFCSLSQAKRWIHNPEWVKDLRDKGFHLYKLEVNKDFAYLGYTQCCFFEEGIINSTKLDIMELLC